MYADEVGQMNNSTNPPEKPALSVISAITFVGFMDTNLLIPIMSLYALELGASVGTVGIIVGLYSIVNIPANVFFGRLVDRLGYKLLLVIGLLGDATGMFLYSLCCIPVHLVLVRIFHGITGGIFGPATMSAVAHQAAESRQGRAMAFYGISLGSATLVGFGLSGIIASRLGYNMVFQIGAGLLVGAALLSLLLLGKWKTNVIKREASGGEGWGKLGDLLSRRGLITPYCAIFAQYFSFGCIVTLLPVYVKNLGMDAFHVGMLLTAFAVMFIIVQLPLGNLSDRLGRFWLSSIGLVLGIIALLLITSLTSFTWLVVVMAIYGVGYGAIFPSISAMVAENTTAEERGMATGIFHALLTAGVAVGAVIAGWAGDSLGVETGLLLSPSMLVVALVVVLVLMRRKNSVRSIDIQL